MKKRIIILAVLCAVVIIGWVYLSRSMHSQTVINEDSVAVARVANLSITVTENGFLKAKNSVNVDTKFSGHGKISWLIEEGEEVEEGQTLVEFDKTELETEISELENRIIQYEAELEASRANLEIQERDSNAGIEKAELQRELARLALERYEKGEAPNELRKLRLAEEKAQSEFDRAKERFEQVPQLQAEGFLTKAKVEEERIMLREAEISLENAIRSRELQETYTHIMELTQKQSALKDAQRELENSKQKSTISLKEKQAQVTQKERQLTSTQKRLEQQQKEMGYMTLTAPNPGTVHYGDPEQPWRRDDIKLGNSIWQGQTVITLPDLREMQVIVQVHEADIDLVKEDMDVNVTVETHKGSIFRGKVTKIATVASSRNWTDAGNRSFKVEITMEPAEIDLKAGVTARAEIQVEELENVLQVPIHAVVAEGDRQFCFVARDGEVEERTVTIGKHNSHYVEIASGLEEGEKVLLYDPRDGGAPGPATDEEAVEEEPENPVIAGGVP